MFASDTLKNLFYSFVFIPSSIRIERVWSRTFFFFSTLKIKLFSHIHFTFAVWVSSAARYFYLKAEECQECMLPFSHFITSFLFQRFHFFFIFHFRYSLFHSSNCIVSKGQNQTKIPVDRRVRVDFKLISYIVTNDVSLIRQTLISNTNDAHTLKKKSTRIVINYVIVFGVLIATCDAESLRRQIFRKVHNCQWPGFALKSCHLLHTEHAANSIDGNKLCYNFLR